MTNDFVVAYHNDDKWYEIQQQVVSEVIDSEIFQHKLLVTICKACFLWSHGFVADVNYMVTLCSAHKEKH